MSIKRFQNTGLLILIGVLAAACTDIFQPVKKQLSDSNHERTRDKRALVEITQPGKYLQNFANKRKTLRDTLFIMDLDDTTITSPEGQWLGRSDMFYDLLDQELKLAPGKTRKDIAETLDPLLTEVYQRIPVILTDETLPESIETLKAKGATVIGMTARGKTLWDVTLKQLEKTAICFSDITAGKDIGLGDAQHIIMRQGVVFATQSYSKGEVVSAMMRSGLLPEGLKRVVMVDDRQRHLNSVASAVKKTSKRRILFTPVLCTYPNSVKPYNSEEATEQLQQFLDQWHKDPAIARLIQADPFTRQFLKRCASSERSKQQKQCWLLLQDN